KDQPELRQASGDTGTSSITRSTTITRCPRQESNLRTRFRKPLLSPLSYEGRGPRAAEEENVAANSPRPTILRHTDDSLASSAGAVRGAHEGQTKCKYEGFCFALRA